MNGRSTSRTRTPRTAAFTLVEVMISILIALVLILGISQIFSMAQRATGAGNQVLDDSETNRAAHERLNSDFMAMANGTDSPGLVIASYSATAFRSNADRLANRVTDPRRRNDLTSATASLAAEPATVVDYRVHRLDRICFWARDRFTRQTGDKKTSLSPPPSLTSPTTSNEAFIWIGHLDLPDNATIAAYDGTAPQNGKYLPPAAGSVTTNQNNFFASDWILGRVVIPMVASATGEVEFQSSAPAVLSILNAGNSTDGGAVKLFMSRYDLAQTSIAAYRASISATNFGWWQDVSGIRVSNANLPLKTTPPTVSADQRYWGNPFIKKPTSTDALKRLQQLSGAVSQASPVFVRGCTQFIVEFAGDYVKQDPTTGKPTAAGQDGQIDFCVDPTTGARHIRWYGFQRDTNDDGKIDANIDVVPLHDYLVANSITPAAAIGFERTYPTNYNLPALNTNSPAYVCAWGPDTDSAGIPRPKMIRITMAVDDPTGHLNTEQYYEYVYNLP